MYNRLHRENRGKKMAGARLARALKGVRKSESRPEKNLVPVRSADNRPFIKMYMAEVTAIMARRRDARVANCIKRLRAAMVIRK